MGQKGVAGAVVVGIRNPGMVQAGPGMDYLEGRLGIMKNSPDNNPPRPLQY
jgi:hypothetical protein